MSLGATVAISACFAFALMPCGGGGGDGGGGAVSDAGNSADSGNGPSRATEGAGARFFPRFEERTYSDGTQTQKFVGFYDRARGEDCSLKQVGVDEFLCLPEAATGTVYPVFKVAACTQRVFRVARGTKVTYAPLGSFCSPRVGKLGPAIPTPQALYTKQSDGNCVAGVTVSTADVYDFPSEIPASEFGAFVRTPETAAFPDEKGTARFRLRAWRYTSADGAFVSTEAEVLDLQLGGGSFTVRETSDGLSRLVPQRMNGGLPRDLTINGGYGDPACTDPLALWTMETKCYDEDKGAYKYAVTSLCSKVRVFESLVPPLEQYFTNPGCVASPGSTATRAFYPGSKVRELDPVRFSEAQTESIAATRSVEGSTLSPRNTLWTTVDGFRTRRQAITLFHKGLNVACRDDGPGQHPRCLPQAPRAYANYADSACTAPVLTVDRSGCGAVPLGGLVEVQPGTIVKERKYVRLSGVPTRITTIYDRDYMCRAYSLREPRDAYPLNALIEVPREEFPERTSTKFVPDP